MYAVIHKEDHRIIGFVGLMNQTIDGEVHAELGYRLYRDSWGQGIASEAALAVGQYAFEQLGFDRIVSIIDPQNVRSLKVAERIGMVKWKETTFHGIYVHVYRLSRSSRSTDPRGF